MNFPLLHRWPSSVKKLIFVFTLVTLVGVVIGGVMIEVTTNLTPEGIIDQYKGMKKSELATAEVLKFPKPLKDMLITTHNHILGLSSLFLIVGFLYLCTGRQSGLHITIAAEPFISLIFTFGGLWVVRYLWPPFVYVVIISGVLMLVTYAWMSIAVMINCLRKSDSNNL